MNASLERQVFKPELVSRRGELIAWLGSFLVNGAWVVLLLFGQPLSFWLPILGFPLLLIASGISLSNWMDRHTFLKLESQGVAFSNGLRNVRFTWLEIKEVRVLPAQWGQKIQVFGEDSYFGFHTLGEVEANGRLLGRTGFVEGEQVLKQILEKAGLSETKQVDIGNQQEGYYYSRE